MKYITKKQIRIRTAEGKIQVIPAGLVISFDAGDQVDIPFLLAVEAIVEHTGGD